MSRAPSGKIRTYIYKKEQKNGDIYVFERQTKYDPDKQYNVVLHDRLLYKIPKGETEPVPTRPKKTPLAKRRNAGFLQAHRGACHSRHRRCGVGDGQGCGTRHGCRRRKEVHIVGTLSGCY